MTRSDRASVESVVLAFPESVRAATEFRSTWVVSSLEGLRAHGHYERYLKLLRGHRDEIVDCVAGAWLPMSVVRSHYEACDALGLRADDVARMARDGGTVRRTWHAHIISAAQRPDANVWYILKQLHKIWLRGANGGAVGVFQLDHTRARVEYIGCELFDIPYFRLAAGASIQFLGERVSQDLRVSQHLGAARASAVYLLEWS